MASTDKGQHFRQGADGLLGSESAEAIPGCQAGDLKSLLAAIVDQISEADRRHTDTLAQVQDRLAGIGREAKAIKPRVPDSFAAAFERIEAGMSELASRIAEAGDASPPVSAPVSPPPAAPAYAAPVHASPIAPAAHVEKPAFIDPPAALRSASDHMMAATRRREEEASRAQAGVDTFDVIESSLPGNVSDPWDRDAAEALTGLYESVGSGYVSKISAQPSIAVETHAIAPPAAHVATAASMPGVDLLWLESRFAELSKNINESIADVRPDQGFFAIGQRVDRLEQHFNGLLENVATHNDVEGVRLIEAHVSELANHMENAHQQLMRLDTIEDQLAGIAAKLDDVHHAASVASNDLAPMPTNTEVDMHAVARTAAEAAASHFSSMKPSQDSTDTRDMLRSFIAEARQGEENTTALLDTLQQAMIRLLDRIDTMELNTLQSVQAQAHAHAQSAPQEYVREQVRFAVDPGRNPNMTSSLHETENIGALDAAVAAVASAKSMSSPFAQAPGGPDMSEPISPRFSEPNEALAPKSPEKMRQDFIADARRAKMRLNAEGESQSSGVVVERPEASLDTASADPKSSARTTRGAAKTTTVAADTPASTSMITPRLRVMALAGALALMGGWYATQVKPSPDAAVTVAADPATASAPAADAISNGGPAKDASTAPATKSDGVAPADAAKPGDAPAPKAGGSTQLNMRDGTRGEIVNDQLTVGSTSVPLLGIAVDTEKSMTPAEVQHAKQQQSIAAVSTRLGEAALQNPAALAFPAAISPSDAAAAVNGNSDGPLSKSAMGQSSALDMPPATVGPLSLRLAAANGDSSAQFEVGARLAEGKGTNQNFKDAAKWYQRSASQGFAQAQYRLGTLYERGLGLKADPARATEWYKKAAEQGNVKAMHNLAVLSANQPGGTPDYATAAQWFEQAAEHGLSDSQFNLAVLHENGLGVEQNVEVAFKWLALAAKSGDKEAIRRRDILQGKLTGEQLKKAEGLVGTWKAQSADPKINDPRKAGEAWKSNPANGVSG
jgi:localization factor PodJL